MTQEELLLKLNLALNNAQLLANASAVAHKQKLAHAAPASNPPKWAESIYHHRMHQLLQVYHDLCKDIRMAKRAPRKRVETATEFRARIIKAYEGKSAEHAAEKENLSPAYIRKIRAEAEKT